MSGAERRSDGLLGESDHERRRSLSAPPGLYATALCLDSTGAGGVASDGDRLRRWPSGLGAHAPSGGRGLPPAPIHFGLNARACDATMKP